MDVGGVNVLCRNLRAFSVFLNIQTRSPPLRILGVCSIISKSNVLLATIHQRFVRGRCSTFCAQKLTHWVFFFLKSHHPKVGGHFWKIACPGTAEQDKGAFCGNESHATLHLHKPQMCLTTHIRRGCEPLFEAIVITQSLQITAR